MFQQEKVRHILVRHEQGAVHAAEGYARSTGKVGCVLVTSGPGRDQCGDRPDRRADGFDPDRLHHRAGADASDRQRRVPGMRHGRHHAALHQAQLSREERSNDLPRVLHEAFHIAASGRPGPGGGRHPEGRPVRQGHLSRAEGGAAQELQAEGQGRPRQDQGRGRDDGERQAADVLYRRRRHQFRQGGEPPAARVRAGSPASRSPRR